MPVEQEDTEVREESTGAGDAQDDGNDGMVAPNVDQDGGDAEVEEEAERPRALRDPRQPSRAEREEHDLSHIPFRPWCDACVRGRAKDKLSLRLCGVYSENLVPRVRMDYAKLTEVLEESEGLGEG